MSKTALIFYMISPTKIMAGIVASRLMVPLRPFATAELVVLHGIRCMLSYRIKQHPVPLDPSLGIFEAQILYRHIVK